jgi:hypothetical protein
LHPACELAQGSVARFVVRVRVLTFFLLLVLGTFSLVAGIDFPSVLEASKGPFE